MFSGEGEYTRASRITNRRWAQSAFGTATAAALTPADTVYSITPVYHPSGLMTSIGGAIAGGARLAVARRFDVSTFWEEVRRYGVTVASYTWTMLDAVVDAPPQAAERHHPLRLFIGSGMPRALWRRVEERFSPARVVEFYASTEAGAILVNVRGAKLGSMGRPLPGSAEVRIAEYDLETGGLTLGRDGFARRCGVDEVGMLLARVGPNDQLSTTPLRSLFERGDAWVVTGDLFRRDGDGDYWRVDGAGDVIHTENGPVFTTAIRDALGAIPAVDLALAYGVPREADDHEIAVAAVTLRAGRELTARELSRAMGGLERESRPALVHVVERIPVTTWFRPLTQELRAAGIAEPARGRSGVVPRRRRRDLPGADRAGAAAADAAGYDEAGSVSPEYSLTMRTVPAGASLMHSSQSTHSSRLSSTISTPSGPDLKMSTGHTSASLAASPGSLATGSSTSTAMNSAPSRVIPPPRSGP